MKLDPKKEKAIGHAIVTLALMAPNKFIVHRRLKDC